VLGLEPLGGFGVLAYRRGEDAPRLMTPGESVDVRLRLAVTANLFRRGHRIRVHVTSSVFLDVDGNPNRGTAVTCEDQLVTATNTIFHDGERRRLIRPGIHLAILGVPPMITLGDFPAAEQLPDPRPPRPPRPPRRPTSRTRLPGTRIVGNPETPARQTAAHPRRRATRPPRPGTPRGDPDDLASDTANAATTKPLKATLLWPA
jgi:hypothetical protein